jgi:Arc/MetJ-type ribon-helix-helix transcriptional regulator
MSKRREPKTNRVTVIMGESLKAKIEELAEEGQRSISDFIRLVLLEYCEAIEEQKLLEAKKAT